MKKLVIILAVFALFIGCDDSNNTDTHEHQWGEWVITKEPTLTEEGEEEKICLLDPSHVEKRAIPKLPHEHIWSEWIVTQEPTCLTNGMETRTCSVVPHNETRSGVAALGHLWGNWIQTSETEETRTCTRSSCIGSETRAFMLPTKNFTFNNNISGHYSNEYSGTLVAKKDFPVPAPLFTTLERRVLVSDTEIQFNSRGYVGSDMLIIIDAEGYGWASNGYVITYYSSVSVFNLTSPITVYSNRGYGWTQATSSYYIPEEQPFDDGYLGISFTYTQDWLFDWDLKAYNATTSFIRMPWKEGTNVYLSDVAKNPDEWSVTTSGGTLTMKLGAPKDEYLLSFDEFKVKFCELGGNDLSTNNSNLKTLDFVIPSNINGFELLTTCNACPPPYSCGASLIYANEDGTISGFASAHGNIFGYDLNLKKGWNVVHSKDRANTVSGVLGNHVLYGVYNK